MRRQEKSRQECDAFEWPPRLNLRGKSLLHAAKFDELAAHIEAILCGSRSSDDLEGSGALHFCVALRGNLEELIGADTVDTIPPATFDAFRDHGRLRPSLTENVEAAAKTMADLAKAGISMKEVTDKLMVDGVKLFSDAFKTLLDAVSKTAGVPA